MEKEICLLIFYYGQLPPYFKIFLKGAEYNPNICFKIITDNSVPDNLPPNVEFEKLTIKEFRQIAFKKIGIKIHKQIKPYKFCDFRPAYGAIMEDYLEGYNFWGYCDLDMIMGDLTNTLIPLTKRFDLISSRKTWMHGPLTVYRNTFTVNKLFLKGKDWQKVFESESYMGFDETGKRMGEMRKAVGLNDSFLSVESLPKPKSDDIESFTDIIFKFRKELNIKALELVADSLEPSQKLRYKNGKILDQKNKEWACYHWVMEKKLNQFGYPDWSKVPDEFMISRFGFFNAEIINTPTYVIQILKKDIFGKIKDSRDIIWLIRNRCWSEYYHEWYLKNNPTITRFILFLTNPKYAK